MYSPIVVIAAVLVSGLVAEPILRDAPKPKFDVEENTGLLKVDVMNSLGLICHDAESEEIAKVECGGEGTSSAVGEDALGMSDVPEFSVAMTCKGHEAKLLECDYKLQQFNKCDSFVAVHCGGARRSLSWVF